MKIDELIERVRNGQSVNVKRDGCRIAHGPNYTRIKLESALNIDGTLYVWHNGRYWMASNLNEEKDCRSLNVGVPDDVNNFLTRWL